MKSPLNALPLLLLASASVAQTDYDREVKDAAESPAVARAFQIILELEEEYAQALQEKDPQDIEIRGQSIYYKGHFMDFVIDH